VRAADLVLGSTVVDMLGLLTLDWDALSSWHRRPEAFGVADFLRLKGSGVDVFHPAVETAAAAPQPAALAWLGGWNSFLGLEPCLVDRVDSIASLSAVTKLGQVGVVLGFQDSDHFLTAADVELFHSHGQRVSQLTYNETNRLGSGCYEEVDHGLTAFGAEIVTEMNRIGMAIDVSHCGERTTKDAIAASRKPVLVTHSNCKALVPWQPRCKPDEALRRLAAGGGVMGITVVRGFVGAKNPTIDDLLDHFDHVVEVAGVEHVGLGSDLDVTGVDPKTGALRPAFEIRGLDPPVRVFQIADGLLRRGWTDRDVELALGGNFLRALESIWSADARRAAPPAPPRDPFCPAPAIPRPDGVAGGTGLARKGRG
jgi:membrane dipeptidase